MIFLRLSLTGATGFSCSYLDFSDSDTSDQTAVTRYTESPLSLLGSQLCRIFTLLTFSQTWRQRTKAWRRPIVTLAERDTHAAIIVSDLHR